MKRLPILLLIAVALSLNSKGQVAGNLSVSNSIYTTAPRYGNAKEGRLVNGKSVPYTSVAQADSAIPSAYRAIGMGGIKIDLGGGPVSYIYRYNTTDTSLVPEMDYNFMAHQPVIPAIPTFKTVNGIPVIGTGDITVGTVSNGTPAATNGVHLAINPTNDSIIVMNAVSGDQILQPIQKDSTTYFNVIQSGTNDTYTKVSNFVDGTAMTDAKCDGMLYKKINGGYYLSSKINDVEIDAGYFGLSQTNAAVNSPLLNKLVQFNKNISLPAGYFHFTGIITINGQIKIHGQGQILTNLLLDNDLGAGHSLFEYNLNTNLGYDAWGLILENMHFNGQGHVGTAFHAYRAAYLLLNNLNIEQFHGSAMWLDKIQDSKIQMCNIQANGSTGYPPIWITSTVSGDQCNMVQFDRCEIEQNLVSPYVQVDGGIGIMFNSCHAEVRNSADFGNYDFMHIGSADVTITDHNGNNFRNAVQVAGYGNVAILGGRSMGGNIDYTLSANMHGGLKIDNATVGNINMVAYGGNFNFNNITANNINLSYMSGVTTITNGSCDSLTFTAPNSLVGSKTVISGLHITGSVLIDQMQDVSIGKCLVDGNVNVTEAAGGCLFTDNYVKGSTTFFSNLGVYERNTVIGGENLERWGMRSYRSGMEKVTEDSILPVFGSYNVGDRIMRPVLVGQSAGWVCTVAGTNGTAVWVALPKIGVEFAAKTYVDSTTASLLGTIATNTANINTNTASISTNTTAISTNTTAIASKLGLSDTLATVSTRYFATHQAVGNFGGTTIQAAGNFHYSLGNVLDLYGKGTSGETYDLHTGIDMTQATGDLAWIYMQSSSDNVKHNIIGLKGNGTAVFPSLVTDTYVGSVGGVLVNRTDATINQTVETYSSIAGIVANPNALIIIKVASDSRTGSTLANTIYQLWPDNTLIYISTSVISR